MKNYPLIIIGAGSGGLVVAIGAARAGKKVLLIDKGNWGGDCTNFGCIPSKSLIAIAKLAHMRKKSANFESSDSFSPFDGKKVFAKVRSIIQSVRSHEEPKALEEKGVETLTGTARFIDKHTLVVEGEEGETTVWGQKIVIATGSSPQIPQIPGLLNTPYLTNETIFNLEELPKSLCVIGGGPIGCELAQAFSRLGTKVSLVHRRPILLKKEDEKAQEVLVSVFKQEEIELFLNFQPISASHSSDGFILQIEGAGEKKEVFSTHLLIAAGRDPNTEALDLKKAGVELRNHAIKVDRYGRTSMKHIWAIGDVAGGPIFTHAAENQARTVLTSILLPFNKKMDLQAIPRATFTDPEIAAFGMLEKEAEEKFGKEKIAVYLVPLSENDRAITNERTEGFVKVVTKRLSSKILGATIVAPRAGEMISELGLAALYHLPLRKLSRLIHPYPTYNLAIRKASDLWLTQTLIPFLKHPSLGISLKKLIPIGVILSAMLAAYLLGLHKYLTLSMLKENHQLLKAFVGSYPVLSPLAFMAIYAVATALSVPGGVFLSLIGGILFPLPYSTIYVVIGATIGACLIFLAARSAFREILYKKAGPFLKKLEKGFKQNAWSYLLFLRFVPLFPFWLVNIAPAFFQISLITYLWTTFVGIIPGAFAFTSVGPGLEAILQSDEPFSLSSIFNFKIRIALVLIGLVALVPVFIKKIFKKKFGKSD